MLDILGLTQQCSLLSLFFAFQKDVQLNKFELHGSTYMWNFFIVHSAVPYDPWLVEPTDVLRIERNHVNYMQLYFQLQGRVAST